MKKGIGKAAAIIIGLLFLLFLLSSFIVDFQWFKEVGYVNVFLTSIKAKVLIFVPLIVIFFITINLYLRYLRRGFLRFNNIVYDRKTLSTQNMAINITSILLSFIIASAFTGSFWYRILEFLNATDFNVKDPIFNIDVGFYMFKLPLIEGMLGVLITIVAVLVLGAIIFYGASRAKDGLRSPGGFIKMHESPEGKFIAKQIAIFGAILLILLSALFYIKVLNLVYSSRGVAFGASYTDIKVSLPMYRIISVFCIISAFVIAFSIIRKKAKIIIGTAAFMVLLIVSERLISFGVEKFIVAPNAWNKERPYLTYNIDFTRKAFGLDNIKVIDFKLDDVLTQKDIDENRGTIDNIRINEFAQALEVYNQIQAIRNYYRFNDVDIDRYNIGGELKQVFVAPRELDNSNRESKFQTWQNRHLFYTHGYGVVMSYTNTVMSSGLPQFIMKDIPTQSEFIKVDKPQIYFGEQNDDYIVVGARSNEIDYPSGNDNATTRYDGKAGIPLNFFNRILFTLNKGTLNFLLSNDITSNSRIVLNRNIVNRVKKIAPFINYDEDPYLVVSNGRIYWIIDGYTTSSRYPFSEPYDGINYIRNSIKVIVDAYDGTVDFYLADDSDAVAKTINKIYSGLFKSLDKMPEDLKNHLRYSEDVFLIQSRVYEKYHMTNPSVFYNSEDLWSIAKYKEVNGEDRNVEAVYQVMRLPGEENEEFLLTIPFTVAKKENMEAWLAARMDKENMGKMVLIRFPKDKSVLGPNQFNSKINSDTEISSQLSLWNQQGSQVIIGETNIIPINNSLIYVRPLYLRAQSGSSLPELKRVIVGFGEKVVMADSIENAFVKLFNTKIVEEPSAQTPPEETQVDGSIRDLANRASELFTKAQEAQRAGDWAAYGNYLKELEDVLRKLKDASNR
ncbi:UPF0182 family protein [Fonticella tunisiensis]|uniref:UPF0182 protein EDD71_14212 n=1 Tax=Fonticella tunisiensis TaxID=1096341 RepID=A0A4R7K646_9CLOT|nr:UPF0182 family protein [Fonticella tunisiensis]TDT45992.1 hypothetical protein EDD71_14212 [Fonticella tunisiensis]